VHVTGEYVSRQQQEQIMAARLRNVGEDEMDVAIMQEREREINLVGALNMLDPMPWRCVGTTITFAHYHSIRRVLFFFSLSLLSVVCAPYHSFALVFPPCSYHSIPLLSFSFHRGLCSLPFIRPCFSPLFLSFYTFALFLFSPWFVLPTIHSLVLIILYPSANALIGGGKRERAERLVSGHGRVSERPARGGGRCGIQR